MWGSPPAGSSARRRESFMRMCICRETKDIAEACRRIADGGRHRLISAPSLVILGRSEAATREPWRSCGAEMLAGSSDRAFRASEDDTSGARASEDGDLRCRRFS